VEILTEKIHQVFAGTTEEKKALHGKEFYLAKTPQYLKDLGISGDSFIVRYRKIVHHKEKETGGHALDERAWTELANEISRPFAIARHTYGYRFFINVKIRGQWVATGIFVDTNRNINTIKTAFGYETKKGTTEEITYVSPEIRPEQIEFLKELNSHFALSAHPLSSLSPNSPNKSSGSAQNSDESSAVGAFLFRTKAGPAEDALPKAIAVNKTIIFP
jgi:hypothetical protein